MRGDEVGEVDVGGLLLAADEADAFGEGNCVWKRLCKAAITRELEDTILAELKGAEVLFVVCEAGFGRGDHVIDVIGVSGRVIDLNRDRVGDTLIHLAFDIVTSGDEGKKIQRPDFAHVIGEVVTSVGVPFFGQVAG